MPPTVVLENEQITIWYHPETKIVHHQMHQYTHGQAFRDALTAGAEAMKKHRATKWLSDDRKNPVLTADDQKWATDYWQPQVIKAGWKYWAIVQPERLLAKARMDLLAEKFTKLGVEVKMFGDPQEAMKWLTSR
jgi:hypothetical protein